MEPLIFEDPGFITYWREDLCIRSLYIPLFQVFHPIKIAIDATWPLSPELDSSTIILHR